jgi:limonene-1,2-epoxide hydrolase
VGGKDAVVSIDPSEVVREFLISCTRRDFDTALGMVTDDIEYDNVPLGKVFGREGVRRLLSTGVTAAADEIEFVVLHQVREGNVVMNERLDRFRIGQAWLELPVAGLFVLVDCKIRLWRDYFELNRESFLGVRCETAEAMVATRGVNPRK